MELQEFRKDFLEDVRSMAAAMGEGTSAAFVSIVADYLVGAQVLPDFEQSFYTGAGKNNRKFRVDGYSLDEFDYTMNLVIADYGGGDDDRTLTKTEANQIFDRLMYFINEVYNNNLHKKIEISTPCADLVDLLNISKGRIRKYRFLILSDSFMSSRIDTLSSDSINGIPVEYQIWDIERLYKVCLSDMGRENIEINFTDYIPNGIPCLETSNVVTNEFRSFLSVIPGEVLADVYDRYGSQLLEGNVRSFLSTKVAVNKKIRETILSSPNMFFVYNNGVAATAVDVVIENKQEGKFITYAKDFQIINGGQTTASLSSARYKDKAELNGIYVQMKLTEIDADPDKTGDLVQKISRSSNSQNKVSDADFFSTHPFHIRMEQISRRLFAPAVGGAQYETHWFYERARGQYLQAQMRMTKTEKSKFVTQNPKYQLVTKTDFAKARNSWRCLPHVVSKGAQTNFMSFAEWVDEEWMSSDSVFNEMFFQDTISLMILFKHIENLITHQTWYEQGYRANIVTYSIALFAHLIKKQYPDKTLDLQIIWNRQQVPEIITKQMLVITKQVLDSITGPEKETVNVTQWCKREACWTKVKGLDISLISHLDIVLIDKEEIRAAVKDAKKDQKLVSGVEAQEKVLELGPEYWSKIMVFAQSKRFATIEELKALKIASQMPLKLPNAFQCQKLLKIIDRAREEGIKE